jgi:Zn-dependent protease with chaperone function
MKRTVFRHLILFVALCLVSGEAFAEKFKGYIWDKAEAALLVEGIPVETTAQTKIERRDHKGIAFGDLRIGWEVEVEGERGQKAFLAKKIKVKQKRYDDTDIKGFVEVRDNGTIEVEGRRIIWPSDAAVPELRSGMQLEGKGIILDSGAIQVKKVKVLPAGRDEDEAKYMSLVAQEVDQLKEKLPLAEDPELQAYVKRVGESLIPKWVSPDDFNFTFSVIEDPSLNAFALPDGTVVVHTGLLAALENEAQLATVMGHEIAHATHKHGYRGYKQQSKMRWLQLGAAVGGIVVGAKTDSPWAGLLTGIGSSLTISAIVNGHGRDMEDEADRIGLNYMVDAGYDYMEAPEVWKVFNRYSKDQNAAANFFFGSHSTHRARISNLTREINANYRADVDRAELTTNETEFLRMTARLKEQQRTKQSSR